jgi:branched-chain amino acid transport system ATP-binding protein
VLLIEHDVKLMMGLCDRITVLEYGKQIAEGVPAEIQKNQAVIDAYLGGAH